MPRKGRGGKRTGTPGTAYSNRSDLTQAATAAPGQEYGQAAAQLRAQQSLPLPKQGMPAASAAAPPAPASPATPGGPPPGSLGPLDAPTARPNEPITTGLSSGPGPGPEALGPGAPTDPNPTVAMLKGILARYPNPDLQALITEAESR